MTIDEASQRYSIPLEVLQESVLALYPTPAVVIGAMVNRKPNWFLAAHVGIIGQDRILISCAKAHYTNVGIKQTGAVSVNMVTEDILSKADHVGRTSFIEEYDLSDKTIVLFCTHGTDGLASSVEDIKDWLSELTL